MIEYFSLIWKLKGDADLDTFTITIPELSRQLHCTERHVKNIIKKLQENGWLIWHPGVGRGNRSRITFTRTLDQVVKAEARRLATEKTIEHALAFLQQSPAYDQMTITTETILDFILNDVEHEGADHLRFPSYRPLPILHPAQVDRRTENHFMSYLYDTLVQFDHETEAVIAGLAHAWTASQSYTKWTLYLRKGLYFHHKEQVTAREVCQCFQLHQQQVTSPYHWVMKELKEAKSINELTVQLSFNKPMPFLLECLTTLAGAIFTTSHEGQLVGAGPYQLSENSGEKLSLVVHQSYYHARPFLDQITLYFFPVLYDNADIDIETQLANINFYHYPYQYDEAAFHAYTHVDQGSKLLTFNGHRGQLAQDKRLRHKIRSVLQPAELIEQLGGNRYATATRMRKELEADQLGKLAAESFTKPIEVSYGQTNPLTLACYQGAGNEQDGEWICQQLSKEGIDVQLKVFDYQAFFQQDLTQFDLLLGEQTAHEHPLMTYFKAFLGHQSLLAHHLPVSVKDQVEACLLKIQKPHQALAFLDAIEGEVSRESYGMYLYRLKQYAIYPNYFKNVKINTLGWLDFKNVWFDRYIKHLQ
ncbi:ABC transporter substrate-binding protein [Amphibacillus cookii]|uniref:ABC transporter substrate-binding protein n=1 Tax=Amphibacillus cookii TaxID=767787 RepID=UPI00195DE68E|nr:ABC transporter substrate-binding protein [Amphibacillus cookii]MBM7542946.1 MarR-like DNA-binding transcriptional regulator SgrR of sgrS sRNA [Amphibacillus cookii]